MGITFCNSCNSMLYYNRYTQDGLDPYKEVQFNINTVINYRMVSTEHQSCMGGYIYLQGYVSPNMGVCEIYILFYMLQKWNQRDEGYADRSSGICPFISGQAVPYILKECSATQKFYSSKNTASPTPEHLGLQLRQCSNLKSCKV